MIGGEQALLDPKQIKEFVCESNRDLPDDQKVIHLIKGLSNIETMQLEDIIDLSDIREGRGKFGSKSVMLLRLGWKGWSNMRNGNGSDVAFKIDKMGRAENDNFEMVSLADLWDISTEITRLTNMTKEQVKN